MTGTEAEVEAGHHPPSAMTGTVAEGLAPPPVMSEGAGGRLRAGLFATWSPAARRRGAAVPSLPSPPSRGRRPRRRRGAGSEGGSLPARLCAFVARRRRPGAGPGAAEDELVQRLAAVQLRQAGAVAGPKVHRPGAGHPGRGEPLARRRHPRLRRR